MHSLQTTFASHAGEEAWTAHLRDLFERRELGEAERILRTALIELGGDVPKVATVQHGVGRVTECPDDSLLDLAQKERRSGSQAVGL